MFSLSRTPFSSMTVRVVSTESPKVKFQLTMRGRLDLSSRAYGVLRGEAAFGIDKMGCEDGIDQGGFPQASLPLKSPKSVKAS